MIFCFSKKTNADRAKVLEAKGDRLSKKGKLQKAYDCYHKAAQLAESKELYEKLIALLNDLKNEWTEEHFSHSLFWEMRKQELEDPIFKRINARSEPEFQAILDTIKKMMGAMNTAEETQCVEKIVSFGNEALYPLIDMLLAFKQAGKKS